MTVKKEFPMHLKYLNNLWKRGADFLGTEYAIMCGGMTWVSEHNLTSSISNSGAFGVLAAGNLPREALEAEIDKTKERTSKPFGINLITIAPNFEAHVDIVIEEKVKFVIFAGAIPPSKAMERARQNGVKILCFAPTLALAKRMIKQGADALIIEGNEAGGHVGPVSTSVLAQEILLHVTDVPVFVAGGIGTGEMIAQYLLMGAAGCQLGTRFAAAEESIVHPNFKQKLIHASAKDAMPTPQFDPFLPVIPVRAIVNEGTKEFSKLQLQLLNQLKEGRIDKDTAQMKLEEFWVGALRKAVIDGDIERGSLMAGQSVGMVKKIQPVKEIIQELVEGAERKLREIFNWQLTIVNFKTGGV